uniref:Uncharacterized protein n=1 Tax=Anguilla anguilla TaxID=7936 RepID=A0A0E9VM93_ANGAN
MLRYAEGVGVFYCGVTFTNIFAGTSMCSKHCQVPKNVDSLWKHGL